MEIRPLKRDYGISSRFILGILLLVLIAIGGNVYVVLHTDLGAGFYSYWLSSRVLFAQGENPYGSDIFEQIIRRFPEDRYLSGFTLPLYAVIPVFLFSFIDNFEIALIIWMTILEALLVGIGMKTISAFQIDRRTFTPLKIGTVMLLSYYSVVAVLDGDIGILAVFLLMMALDAIRSQEDEFAGILLAFATIKYSLTLLPIIWIFIWCLANRRTTVITWFFMILAFLILLSVLFMTNWITEFIRSVIYYYKYLNPLYFSRLIENWQPELGGRIGWAISGFLILIMIIEWIVNARGNVRAFEWVTALTITIGFLSGIPNIGKNLYMLWIPLAYAMDKINLRWTHNGKWISLVLVLSFLVIPWLNQRGQVLFWQNPIDVLNIIFPAVCLILLYWNRWWTIQSVIEPF
ncbi:MAG TPA: hypothetical protein P5198_02675 [Flexilinea sp.]|nr:hypothetical protein [Flexilinea sp.]